MLVACHRLTAAHHPPCFGKKIHNRKPTFKNFTALQRYETNIDGTLTAGIFWINLA